ncbi:hypothetical protein [Halococcoides cellulosivorans]|uniref:Uncharacterized protein n=1 Tax=Halococcoides cellulosivorans TaxID=1679096 RepID=A0A2R4WZJ8_9EURY|nr:hypothetical protein [Halococcoides cellulosivorans]AWB26962.1 hypothetical protein HARCEL1_04165 [Halococcoides cellulosivorans]
MSPQSAEVSASEASDVPSNTGAYLLTVGMVTIAFGALFTLVFSDLVALLLVGAVAVVALISVAAGLSTDSNLLFPQG